MESLVSVILDFIPLLPEFVDNVLLDLFGMEFNVVKYKYAHLDHIYPIMSVFLMVKIADHTLIGMDILAVALTDTT